MDTGQPSSVPIEKQKPSSGLKARLQATFPSISGKHQKGIAVDRRPSPGQSGTDSVLATPTTTALSQEQVAESCQSSQPVAGSTALHLQSSHNAPSAPTTTEASTEAEPNNEAASENRDREPNTATVPTTQPQSLWQQALARLQTEHADDYECLRNILPGQSDSRWKALSDLELPQLLKTKDTTAQHAAVQRLKRYLPSLVAAKGLANLLAKLDPHHVAPYVVTGFFFAIEFSLNSIPEDLRGEALEILAENVAVISKWTSFESNTLSRFQINRDGDVQAAIRDFDQLIPEIYVMALKLQARLQRAFGGSKRRLGIALASYELEAWKADLSRLKRQDKECSWVKDNVKERLEGLGEAFKILTWLKELTDPEPSLKAMIRRTRMDQERYENAGKWFTDWLYECQPLQNWPENKDGHRVFWLKGTMGTGKTTLMCQAITKLEKEGLSRPTGSFRVIHYFCYASGAGLNAVRPSETTIIRSLCRKLAWLSSNKVSSEAIKFYGEHAPENRADPEPSDWLDLLRQLLEQSPKPVILVVDALDECGGVDYKEASGFLTTISNIVRSLPNLLLVCSARCGINVGHYFGDKVYSIDAAQGGKSEDMENFIDGEIAFAHERLSLIKDGIFVGNDDKVPLKNLKIALKQGSNGI